MALALADAHGLTFAGEAVDKAQETQKADLVPRVSEVGPSGVNVAGSTTLRLAHVGLQHQAAGGLSALLEPADTTCGQGGQLVPHQSCPPVPLPTPSARPWGMYTVGAQ